MKFFVSRVFVRENGDQSRSVGRISSGEVQDFHDALSSALELTPDPTRWTS